MPLSVIKALLEGDQNIVSEFVRANEFWERFFEREGSLTAEHIAQDLNLAQSDFEDMFPPRDRGFWRLQFLTTMFGHLYDDVEGWSTDTNYELAIKMIQALRESDVSNELRTNMLDDAIKLFSLDQGRPGFPG
jgi:hypothetical protein